MFKEGNTTSIEYYLCFFKNAVQQGAEVWIAHSLVREERKCEIGSVPEKPFLLFC